MWVLMSGRTRKPGATRWYPVFEFEQSALDSLAGGGQATIADVELEDRGTGVAYHGGAVVSFRLWMDIKAEAILETAPSVHIMIVPAGEGIPSVSGGTALKQAEHLHWAMKKMMPVSDPGSSSLFVMEMEIKTARRFRQGDRFIIVLVNHDTNVAFGAAAVGGFLLDAYIRPD